MPLTAEMLSAAVELDQLCLGGLWTLDGYRRELESPNSDLIVLQADSSSELLGLGCVWAILDEAHITVLAVHPNYRQQGFGQALLCSLLTLAWQRGLEWATLEVKVSNQIAISLYRKFDFQEVGRRRRYYQDTGEDALILWRKGLQHQEFPRTLQTWKRQIDDRLYQSGWHLSWIRESDRAPLCE
ncbi:MAG: ribosomal protein S18-alanine N-acetyltransferase [Cyanobacteria bacterium CRU_2_1]|nr:ribosomal protein S18-alanine N-acetyltransferase [Cyanobacteria bacterium RU_5_0]NJR57375.1 ribosomal protein S18-alanine N-acetyltransferase [Cyanobacteria bacterium CRU_2_1]